MLCTWSDGLVELIFEAGCCLQNLMLTELLAMMSESGAVYKTVQVSTLSPVEHQTWEEEEAELLITTHRFLSRRDVKYTEMQ